MAPPAGTLRVGRYFAALAVIFAILYALVAFGSTHKPKLGLDLVGGIRVVFTALTPQGSPAPTSSQMTQARQILENRINGTGVTGSTVVVQNGNQLVVEIPNGTSTDLATLGQAAVLNFRGLVAPAVQTTCVPPAAAGSGSGSAGASPSGSSGASSSPSATSSGSATSGASPSAGTASASASPSNSGAAASERPLAKASSGTTAAATSKAASSKAASSAASSAASPTGTASGSGSPSGSPSASPSAAPTPTACLTDPFTDAKAPSAVRALKAQLTSLYKVTTKNPTIWDVLPNAETCPSPAVANASCRAYSALSSTQQAAVTTALQSFDCSGGQAEPDTQTGGYYACQGDQRKDGTASVFLLGHVIVKGTQIDSADAQAPNANSGDALHWTVALKLTSSGGDNWSKWTSKYNTGGGNGTASPQTCTNTAGSQCSLYVGFTLNGEVISIPVSTTTLDVNTSVSGNFTQDQAKSLAQQLDYGKLPVSFRADDTETVSATLGNSQLEASFVAGGIGLVLVVLYSLIYYRGLGLVTVASLIVSAGLTYALLVILGTQLGFTLDLAGIAGFIVALGITADSFVVFFERLKDEVHEGRSARVAVPRAWIRARRTILSADTVSFLAAAILYFFASADVKGFAFTLGMSTVLDLAVVFLFTHPLVALLSRSAAFGSSRFTGLDAVRGTRTPIADVEAPPRARGRKSGGTTAVVDNRTQVVADAEPEVATDSTTDPTVESPPDLEKRGVAPEADAADDEISDEPQTPRRRVTPESGTAAERAAARRARMREQKNDGTSGDEN